MLKVELTRQGNAHIVTMIGHFMKFVITIAIPDKSAKIVAKGILERVLVSRGTSKATEWSG